MQNLKPTGFSNLVPISETHIKYLHVYFRMFVVKTSKFHHNNMYITSTVKYLYKSLSILKSISVVSMQTAGLFYYSVYTTLPM